ncbi:hypothetical protein ACHWQZ_G018740 [Mnemiopsis leidyi]
MPTTRHGAKLESQGHRIASLTPTLDHMYEKFKSGPKPASDFEKSVADFMDVLYCQIKELKNEHAQLRDEMLFRNRDVTDSVEELHLSVVKTEQYSRRDTITVVGLEKPETETETNLSQRVAETLSNSGVQVTPDDFSVLHRNGRDNRTVRGLKPKWVTYQSPTSGFAVKLATGEYFNGIHVWRDFEKIILSNFPNCHTSAS